MVVVSFINKTDRQTDRQTDRHFMTDRQAGGQTDSSPLFCIILCRIPFTPELFHIGIVCLLLWPISSPQRSLGHSLFKQKSSQSFFFFFFFFCFLFYQNSRKMKVFFSFKKRTSLVSTAIAMNRLILLSHLTWLP